MATSYLKRIAHHYSNGGIQALAKAGWRVWHSRNARRPEALQLTAIKKDPCERSTVLIVADRSFGANLNMHPAAMLFVAAQRSGRSVSYLNWSEASEQATLRKRISDSRATDVFVFASANALKQIERELKSSRARIHVGLAGSDDVPPMPLSSGVVSTTVVVDAYLLKEQSSDTKPLVLIPIIDACGPDTLAALKRVKTHWRDCSVIVAATGTIASTLPSDVDVKVVGDCNALISAIWEADAIVCDLASSDPAVLRTLAGAATFLKKWLVLTTEQSWNDYPAVIRDPEELHAQRAPFTDRLANAQMDVFIASHDVMAVLDHHPDRFRKSVSVVVLTHNNKSIIGRFLETLQMHCSHYIAEVVVVDNASSDGSAEHVETNYPWATVLRNARNGCSSGRNLGVHASNGRYIAFFDSDQWVVSGSSFFEALALLERDPNVGAIGWNSGWFDKTRTDLGGVISDYLPRRGMNEKAQAHGYRTDIGFLGTSGFFMKRELWNKIEGFDEFYDPTCFEDTDLSFQVKAAGLDLAFRDLTGVRHQPHQTTKASAGSDAYLKLFTRNADYFREKWRGNSEYFIDHDGT